MVAAPKAGQDFGTNFSLLLAQTKRIIKFMPQLFIRLLGLFQVTVDSQPATGFKYDKARALLAYLAVEADHPHRRETLAALFWPDQTPKLARQSLRQSLSTLRRAIKDPNASPPFLLITGDTVQFNRFGNTWLDVDAFRSHLNSGDHIHPHLDVETCPSCIQSLEKAVALYRGDFLEGLLLGDSAEFETWAITYRERLRAKTLTALHHITRHYLHRGEYSRAQTYALRQVQMEPYREEAHRQLMHILARTGQRSAALAQYQTCRRILDKELGVEPAQETQTLYNRIRSARKARAHNLLPQLTSLVGREGELQQITEYLAGPNCRLLTLTGPGGIGKTRLALQAAQEHVGVFLHGVYFVPLAPLSSTEFLVPTIADALNFSLSGGDAPKIELLNYLREKEMLLALDNFEHLLALPLPPYPKEGELKAPFPLGGIEGGPEEAITLLLDILKHAPDVKLIVTSRERLNLQAEWVFNVRELPFPQESTAEKSETYSAVRLFCERARHVEKNFTLSTDITPSVARICRMVGGIPLGLELAAASVASLPCKQIANQLERNLDILVTTMRDVPPRHRSMRAVFDHSWNLLSQEEQRIFRKLSVFHGGFDLQAAQQVGGDSLRKLTALTHKSLLQKQPSGRYKVHELLRQYAAGKLHNRPPEEEMANNHHCEYFAMFLRQQEEPLKGGRQKEAITEIRAEIDNIRAAWQWAAAQAKPETISFFLESLYYFYWAQNRYYEGKQTFGQAEQAILASGQEDSLLLAKIWTRQAEFDMWLADYNESNARLQKSIQVCRTLNERGELALALYVLGTGEYYQGEYAQSKERFEESLALCRRLDDKPGMALALNCLANVIRDGMGDYEQIPPLYDESLALAREIGDQFGIARVLINQGTTAYRLKKYKEAQRLFRESMNIYREIDYRHGLSASLSYLGQVDGLLGEYDSATELLYESLNLNRETGDRLSIAERLKQLGDVAWMRGAYQESKQYFDEALSLAMEIQAFQVALNVLIGVANLFAQTEKKERALELLAFVSCQPAVSRPIKDRALEFFAEYEAGLSPQAAAGCREKGKNRTLAGIVAEVLDG